MSIGTQIVPADRYAVRNNLLNIAELTRGMQALPGVLKQLGFANVRKGQDSAIASIMGGQDILVVMNTAAGKCLKAGTPVLLFNGDIVPVETIKVGDLVMGPDSRSRKVVSLARGSEEMFEVRPVRGESYTVNKSHTLSLKLTNTGRVRLRAGGRLYAAGDIADISVEDYFKTTPRFREVAKLWSVGVEFPKGVKLIKDLPPYILGAWLGDGSAGRPQISKPDAELEQELREYAKAIGASFSTYDRDGNGNNTHSITFPNNPSGRRGGSNRFTNALRLAGVEKDKSAGIPAAYLKASRKDRLELLAGLLDTDGHKSTGRNTYEITFKHEKLTADTVRLARSLGMWAAANTKTVTLPGGARTEVYHRAYISGEVLDIPCRIKRKQPDRGMKAAQKNPLLRGFSLIPQGVGDYFGFSVEGPDHRFLLGDFSVTHNSAVFIIPTLAMGWRTLVFSPLIALMNDQVHGLLKKGVQAGMINGNRTQSENDYTIKQWMQGKLTMLYVAPERLSNASFVEALNVCRPDMIVTDEAHCLSNWSDTFRPAYCKIGDYITKAGPTVVSAFTATCPPEVEEDIRRVLCMSKAKKLSHYMRRDNLKFSAQDYTGINQMVDLINDAKGPVIVYCSTINRLEETSAQLQRALGDKTLVIYHGQMDAARKEASMRQFMDGHADVVVATNAFGMGVDKSNVRMVIHRDIPANVEALAQELGRAGRDGEFAQGITLFSADSIRTQRQFLDNGHPSRSEVEKFFYAIKSMADKNTMTVSASAEVLEKMSGVHKFAQRAVRSILLGANVLATVPITQKICVIKYTGSSEDAQFRKYKEAVLGVGQVLKDGSIECDVENLADQLMLTDATVTKNLKAMSEKGLLAYTPPPRLTPLKVIGDISAVDFARLAVRRKQCEMKLQQVIDYQSVPDNERHAYIEKCFGH